jgi:hypothetical protein
MSKYPTTANETCMRQQCLLLLLLRLINGKRDQCGRMKVYRNKTEIPYQS